VWEAVASCPKPIVVALGHAANTLWVKALADQSFPTPTALGHFLKQAVEAVEREKETAKLTDLLHKAQEEVRAVRAEREQLKERLARLEREPAALAQEVARLKQICLRVLPHSSTPAILRETPLPMKLANGAYPSH
jgi:exodeoxyribonuclease VII large subunit